MKADLKFTEYDGDKSKDSTSVSLTIDDFDRQSHSGIKICLTADGKSMKLAKNKITKQIQETIETLQGAIKTMNSTVK